MTAAGVDSGLSARVVVRQGSFELDVAVDVGPGEVLGVIGPNGAGKTTLLRALVGLVPLSSGEVCLNGVVLDGPQGSIPASRRGIGVVFQDQRLFGHLSVRDNVAFGPRRRGTSRRAARATADDLLIRFGIGELAGRRPAAISGGQAQRVALARALAPDPHLLLMDEPLSAVDAATRIRLRSELRARLAGGPPVVLVTHDLLDAVTMTDRVMVIEDGRVVQLAPPAELIARPQTVYVARLAGTNLYRGVVRRAGEVRVGDLVVTDAAARIGESMAVRVRPTAVRVRPDIAPAPGQQWRGTVRGAVAVGERVRFEIAGDPDVLVDVDASAASSPLFRTGSRVLIEVDRDGVEIYPVQRPAELLS